MEDKDQVCCNHCEKYVRMIEAACERHAELRAADIRRMEELHDQVTEAIREQSAEMKKHAELISALSEPQFSRREGGH